MHVIASSIILLHPTLHPPDRLTPCIPMSSPEVDVEMLVHITAPTTTRHDNVYRAQAEETLGFVPVRRIEVGRVIWPSKRTFLVEEDDFGRLRELTGDEAKDRTAGKEEEKEGRPVKRARGGGLNPYWDGLRWGADDGQFQFRHLRDRFGVAVAIHKHPLLPPRIRIPPSTDHHRNYRQSMRLRPAHHTSPHNSNRRSSYHRR